MSLTRVYSFAPSKSGYAMIRWPRLTISSLFSSQEVTEKSERITQLEQEKSALIKQLFEARARSAHDNSVLDSTFIWTDRSNHDHNHKTTTKSHFYSAKRNANTPVIHQSWIWHSCCLHGVMRRFHLTACKGAKVKSHIFLLKQDWLYVYVWLKPLLGECCHFFVHWQALTS